MKKKPCKCGRPMNYYGVKECQKCYFMRRQLISWKGVPIKHCKECGLELPQKGQAAQYKKRKFCNLSCKSKHTFYQWRKKGWKSPNEYRAKIEKPEREVLNRLYSKHRSYTLMAKELGVNRNTISNWMGMGSREMRNPEYRNGGKNNL